MNPPINFLPWRQQRRTAFLRFWLLMFVAPLLLAVGITLILRLTSNAEARVNTVLLQAEQQLAHSLQITKPRLLERQQIREQRLQRQRQRQFTRDWQSALEALAALLPEHAWLTTISWQQGTLEIKGLTTSITALNALETSLRLRQFCWAVWLLVLVTLIFLSLTHHEESDALIRLRANHHQQWAALYRLVDTTPFSEEKTLPFSPLDFQLSGAQLVYWHPSAQGGELALKTLWEAVPSAFTRLAERNVSVSRFLLSVEGDDLLFTLQLETPHEG